MGINYQCSVRVVNKKKKSSTTHYKSKLMLASHKMIHYWKRTQLLHLNVQREEL